MAEELGDRVGSRPRSGRSATEGDGVVAGEVRARRAIVAVPPALAGRIEYDPPLPAPRDQLTQRMPMGSVIKCMAVYEEPFWRDDGLSGQAVSLPGPAQVVFDNTPPNGSPGLIGFLEGREARELGAVSVAERRDAVLKGFQRLFGRRAGHPTLYVEKDWSTEPYSRGCYAGVLGPGAWTALRPRPARAGRTGSTGPAPRRRPAGWATWTARSSRASAPPPRSCAPRDRPWPTAAGARAAQASRVVPG